MILSTWVLCFQDCSYSQLILNSLPEPGSPTFFGTRDQLALEGNFSTNWGGGWFQDDSRTLLWTLFLLLDQLHITSSGIHCQRLGVLRWNVLFSTQNTSLLPWKVSSGCHLTLWWESSSLMTQESPPNYDPGTATPCLFSPFFFLSHWSLALLTSQGSFFIRRFRFPLPGI